jgi:hypothetical protein
VLQRAALLPEGPSPSASPASTATVSRYSLPPSLNSSAAKSSTGGSASCLLAAERSPPAYGAHHLRQRLAASPAGSVEGHGLISAFHAVAAATAAQPAAAPGSPQGSPAPHQCSAEPASAEPATAAGLGISQPSASVASSLDGGAAGLAASVELAPGSHLRLLLAHKLPTPGLSCASSLNLGLGGGLAASGSSGGPSPLTPEPLGGGALVAALGGAGEGSEVVREVVHARCACMAHASLQIAASRSPISRFPLCSRTLLAGGA